jgi:mannose/fructose/N-acetylgalactosamine-specific phosphotransferase system component IIC
VSGWLGVALLGGLVGLDSTSFPQAMISRPIIAGTLTGALLGRPLDGALVGLLVEAFALISLPIGAAHTPESGTATVAATAGYVLGAPALPDPGALALALAFGLAWERLTAFTVVLQRRSNGRLLIRAHAVAAGKLEQRHLLAMTGDFLRGAVVCAGGGLLATLAVALLAPLWGLSYGITTTLLTLIATAMLGTAVALMGGLRARRVALLAGAAVGALLVLVLP